MPRSTDQNSEPKSGKETGPAPSASSRWKRMRPDLSNFTAVQALQRRRLDAAANAEYAQQHFVLARLRMLSRRGELWLVVLAILVGAIAGLCVVAIRECASWAHAILFGLPLYQSLSGLDSIRFFPDAFVPLAGGLLLGLFALLLRNRRGRPVDPVEANALHGGRMSITDSLIIVVQTLISNGFGASVGLEAAYTQIGSGFASKLAAKFRLRRADMRMLVGCGAAAAIGAAFGAPLTGAFYAFELIIGTYTISALAPVISASVVAVLVSETVGDAHTGIFIHVPPGIDAQQMALLFVLGLVSGIVGIVVMYLVTLVSAAFDRGRIPQRLRPAIGGILLGVLALISPKILSSGHAAVKQAFSLLDFNLRTGVLLLGLKALASAISIGAGFRGGLFFASLFLGALTGEIFYGIVQLVDPGAIAPAVAMLVGMAGLAAAVVGGPLTMAFLALEVSGNLPLAIAVLVSAVSSSLLVRETFGYSFTTWRFHLRGETIRSAHDIGWMRNLTVGRMMRKDAHRVSADIGIQEFRRRHPLGSTQWVVAIEDNGQYAGIVVLAELYSRTDNESEGALRPLLTQTGTVLTPAMQAKKAAVIFEKTHSEALAVVTSESDWTVIGILSEAYVLRRYAEETEKARMELAGERN